MRDSLFTIAFLVMSSVAAAQDKPGFVSSPRRLWTAPELTGASDEWITNSLAWSDYVLAKHPPAGPETPVRRAALIRIDDVLHIEPAPKNPIVQRWYRERMSRVLSEIESTRVTSGVRIWKLYDHGFVVRTPSVTYAHDIVPGPPTDGKRGWEAMTVDAAWIERFARQVDVMLISHWHHDHANPAVVAALLKQGKTVVGPQGLAQDRAEFAAPEFAGIVYPRRSISEVHQIGKLKVVAYPGHQGVPIINNVHLVTTPEGFTTVHTGDQSNDDDFAWLTNIGAQHRVDVLFPNCWTNDLPRLARGVHPRWIIPGHENEMAHTVPHREDFTQTYNRLWGAPYPYFVMMWGESVELPFEGKRP